jgi:hypothetical protein
MWVIKTLRRGTMLSYARIASLKNMPTNLNRRSISEERTVKETVSGSEPGTVRHRRRLRWMFEGTWGGLCPHRDRDAVVGARRKGASAPAPATPLLDTLGEKE